MRYITFILMQFFKRKDRAAIIAQIYECLHACVKRCVVDHAYMHVNASIVRTNM
jgi:hypothetical protein